jgi:hypothetical protein
MKIPPRRGINLLVIRLLINGGDFNPLSTIVADLHPSSGKYAFFHVEGPAICASEKKGHILNVIEELAHVESTRFAETNFPSGQRRSHEYFRG